jgi:hypothetical protein
MKLAIIGVLLVAAIATGQPATTRPSTEPDFSTMDLETSRACARQYFRVSKEALRRVADLEAQLKKAREEIAAIKAGGKPAAVEVEKPKERQ